MLLPARTASDIAVNLDMTLSTPSYRGTERAGRSIHISTMEAIGSSIAIFPLLLHSVLLPIDLSCSFPSVEAGLYL